MKILPCEYLYFPEPCKTQKPSRIKYFYLAKTHSSPRHQIFENNLKNFHLIVSKKLHPPLSSLSSPTLTPMTKCISKHTERAP